MSKVKVTRQFNFAHDGVRVETIKVGAVVEGRCGEVALENKWGKRLATRNRDKPEEDMKPAGDRGGDGGGDNPPGDGAGG